jgi:hypothetical protein
MTQATLLARLNLPTVRLYFPYSPPASLLNSLKGGHANLMKLKNTPVSACCFMEPISQLTTKKPVTITTSKSKALYARPITTDKDVDSAAQVLKSNHEAKSHIPRPFILPLRIKT